MNKLLTFLFLFILLVGTTSALSFDNSKSYNSITKEATIKNAFGYGSDIAKIKLDTPQVNYVPVGYTKVFQFTIDSKQIYNKPIDGIKTYDVDKKGNLISRTQKIDLKYWNGESWSNIGDNIPQGQIIVAGFTDVKAGDYVEWIPTLFGVEISEWAIYATDPDLIGYFNFDESSGTSANDSLRRTNLTTANSPAWVTGKINNALNFTAGSSQNASFNNSEYNLRNNFTFNLWVYFDNTGFTNRRIINRDAGSASTIQYYLGTDNTANYQFTVCDSGGTCSNAQWAVSQITAKQWYMITAMYNGTNTILYVNGTLKSFGSTVVTTPATASNTMLGSRNNSLFWSGAIDELGIWNRTLSSADITTLYSNYVGDPFPFTSTGSLNVSGISPSNNAIVNTTPTVSWLITPNITSSVIVPVPVNISNSSLYIFNSSYTSLVNDPSLVAYYKLDGDALDSSRNALNGTLINSPIPVEGMYGGGYNFNINGANQYIDTNYNPNITGKIFAFSLWNKQATRTGMIISKTISGGGSNPLVSLTATATGLRLEINSLNGTGVNSLTCGTDLNVWNHIYGEINPNTNSILIYKNGSLCVNNSLFGITNYNQNTNISIARRNGGSLDYHNGSIDDVMVLNRSLSASEIYVLYNQTQPRYTTTVNSNNTVQINATLSGLSETTYNWTAYANGINQTGSYVGSFSVVQSFSVDNTMPSAYLVTPSNATYIYSINSSRASFNINVSASDTNLDKVWYNSSFNSTNTFVTNNAISILNTSNVFGLHNIYSCANDTVNNVYCNQSSIYIHRNYFSNIAYETESQNFSLELWNVTAPDIYVLNYNGSNYSSTLTNVGTNKYTINTTLDIPTGDSTKALFYYFNDTQFRITSLLNQTVNYASLGICNGTLTAPFLNISFKNETVSQERINASISAAAFNYYIGSGTIVKNYSFISTSENRSYTLCFSPITANITLSESISYLNTISPQREYNNNINVGNTTVQQTLYLLPSITGQYVTFQVINPALQPISNVTINISSGSYGLLETKTTDASGAATFFLNPLVTYTIIASKTGLTNYETSITPTQTEYTLTMGMGTTETSIDDYFRGISYSIYPSQIYLANSTTYTFNFTISSNYWNLDRFGITITNSSGYSFGSNSSTSSSGGTVSLTRNTGDNSSLILKPYWIIDGNTTNISKVYTVYDSSGSDTSLANLRDRIRIYIDAGGFFGLTAFGLNILVFLCIFITTGIISYKFGFTSPFAVFAVMLVLTMMFDQVNFITYADALPEDAATILVAILTLAFGIKEATN